MYRQLPKCHLISSYNEIVRDLSVMTRRRRLAKGIFGETLNLRDCGSLFQREMALEIHHSMKVVRHFLKNPNKYGKNDSGRKLVVTQRRKNMLIRLESYNFRSVKQFRGIFTLGVSIRRVQKTLEDFGQLRSQKLLKKPYLSPQNIQDRRQFVINHISWTEKWFKIIFSDKKKLN